MALPTTLKCRLQVTFLIEQIRVQNKYIQAQGGLKSYAVLKMCGVDGVTCKQGSIHQNISTPRLKTSFNTKFDHVITIFPKTIKEYPKQNPNLCVCSY